MSLLLSTVAFAIIGAQAPALEPRLMRYPDIHGDTVTFTFAGDIWVADAKGGFARRLTSHAGLETNANFSPDGKWIAFTGQYDGNNEVYLIPTEGGEPKRLTFEPETDEVIGWTPDGKVMYTSAYGFHSGAQRTLYIADPQGGLPDRTVVRDISQGALSSDGNTLVYTRGRSHLFNWRRYRGGTQGRIGIYQFKENKYRELPSGREQNYFPMLVGNDVFYISDKKLGTLNLYRHNLGNNREEQLTQFADADIRFPNTDGKTIVYERDGYLYAYDIASKATRKLTPDIRTDAPPTRPGLRRLGDQIESLSLSPSGNRVTVVARGELFSLPAKTGETRNLSRTQGAREQDANWSPDGRTIAYISDQTGEPEVYVRPQDGGEATQLTMARMPIEGIAWSPDSKTLLAVTSHNELHLIDVASKRLTRVHKARSGFAGLDFSADSRFLVFADDQANQLAALFLYEIPTAKKTQITSGFYNDINPVFDLTGKYLYFVSARTFFPTMGAFGASLTVQNPYRIYAIPLSRTAPNPLLPPSDEETPAPTASERPGSPPPDKPTEQGQPTAPGTTPPPAQANAIDVEGAGDRAVPLPMPAGQYNIVTGLKDGLIYFSGGQMMKFDVGTRESTPLGSLPVGGGRISFNPARTKMAYYAGGTLGIVDVRPGLQLGQGKVDTGAVEAIVDPRQEWRQMFWEAWRWERDRFYDPNMRGLNWKAIGDHYAKYLPYVNHRSDLDFVLGLMLGELGTGHSYVSGVGSGVQPVPVGMLGADYRVSSGKIQISKIYNGNNYEEGRRGPLGEPGVNVKAGDYLLEIDGQALTGDTNPHALLVGKAGRTVVLTVNERPNLEGARKVRVRPVSNEGQLRYAEFVEEARRKVDQLSGGRIAYIHVPNTSIEGMVEFNRGFYGQTHKDAVLVDERWNGGGMLPNFFIEALQRKPTLYVQSRTSDFDSPDVLSIPGPKAMLINQYAGSGGDMFPYLFRKAGLGPLIGSRTWGGLVGIRGSNQFVDGGGVTAPEFSIYDPTTNEIVAENRGIDPDIEIDDRPDQVALGKDVQLERAVAYLMGELKKVTPRPPRKEIPRVGPEGQIR